MALPTPAPKLWLHHLADEADAAFLYRELAAGEADPKRSALYTRLAEVENRHVGVWQRLLAENGHAVPVVRVSSKARMMAWLARRFGPHWLLPMLLEEEGQEVKGYLQLYKSAPDGATGGLDALPQNGAVVTLLSVCRLTHRQAYADIFMVACVGPLLALVVVVLVAA